MQNGQVVFDDLPPLPDAAPMPSPAGAAPAAPAQAYEGGQAVYGGYINDRQYAPKPGDEKLYVVFYMRTVPNGIETNKQGRPIYQEVPYVRIHVPGDKNNVIDTKVTNEHRGRFPRQWQQFERSQVQAAPDGTPLAEWPIITRSQAMELRHFGVLTVEQLAAMPDGLGQGRLMGFFDLRRKAAAWLKNAADNSAAVENAKLKEQLADMQTQIARLVQAQQTEVPQPDTAEVTHESPSGGARRGR
jgi:hypothetical protein